MMREYKTHTEVERWQEPAQDTRNSSSVTRSTVQAKTTWTQEELLEQLANNVQEWNNLRRLHPQMEVDFSGVTFDRQDLRGAEFSGVNLCGVKFKRCPLDGANFHKARLDKVNMTGASMSGANFSEAEIKNTQMRGANLNKVNMQGARIDNVDFSESVMRETTLSETDQRKNQYDETNLAGANFTNAEVRRTTMIDANLDGVIITGTNMRKVDLTGATMPGAEINQVNFIEARLGKIAMNRATVKETSFRGADMPEVDFSNTTLQDTKFVGANMDKTKFINTTLHNVDFSEAIMKNSDLTEIIHKKTKLNGADLSGARVTDVKFAGTELEQTIFDKTTFNRADFHRAIVKGTRFIHVDLRNVSGLETVIHHGHSIIDIDTLILSEGNIAKSFLEQTGVPEKIITALSLRAEQNNAYKTCFISYSSKDALFVRSLRDHLAFFGVDIWRDQESLKNGNYFSNEITKAIHSSEKFLLVLSKYSAHSRWVKKEVEIAARKGPEVFSPIRLDAFTKMSQNAWVKDIQSTVHIGNFTQYRRPDTYLEALGHLLWSLKGV